MSCFEGMISALELNQKEVLSQKKTEHLLVCWEV